MGIFYCCKASELEDDGHDEGAAVGVLLQETLEVTANLVLHDAVVAALFFAGKLKGAGYDVAGVAKEFGIVGCEAAGGDLGLAFDLAGALVDGDDGEEDAVFTEMLAVADHGVFDYVGGGVVVDTDAAGGDFAGLDCRLAVDGKDVAVFEQEDLLGNAGGGGELEVALEVAVVAVHGNEELGAHEVDHHAQFFLGAVAGDVDEAVGAVVVDDAGIAALEVIDDAVDGLLVAGDDAGAEEDGVAGFDLGESVVVDGSAGERGHGLALGSGDEDAELVGRGVLDLVGMNDQAGWGVDVAEILRDFGGVIDGAADERDLAAVLVGEVHRDPDAVDGGGEAREEETLLGGSEDVVETGDDGLFAGGEAGAVNVGGVLKEEEDALLAEVGEGLEIEGVAVGRGEIDLEVAGVDDDADGGVDGEGDAVDEGVRDADGEDREDAEVEAAAGEDLDELGVVEEAMLFELAFDVGEGELRAVDGYVEVGEDPGEAADVVLVTVREDDAADLGAVLDEVGDIRDDDVDAEEFFFGEHEAGVNHDDVVAVVEREAVHAELAKSAERDYLQFFISHGPLVYRTQLG
jgi:hypothetical protein